MVLVSEIHGRVNLGDGLLTTYGREIVNFDTVAPEWLDRIAGESLRNAFEVMKQREVFSIFDEIHQADRRALDEIVFDVLGLTQGEREAVYEAVVNLVEARLRKAVSLSRRARMEGVQP